ncbi:hypothetical protein [Scytonema sp. UIC 10036]|uniref:hypothetical protein n=1 Tax=Scytonema sp. UIC 10036 TaxID=2304196 RepID=UPI001FAA2E49|nr:hypothetical protein [Scytonema sp. UIC 10036]
MSSSPMLSDENRSSVCGRVEDVTERKKAGRRTHKANSRNKQQDKRRKQQIA